jgi:two-component system torCAD operon response regulator TorR
MINTIAVVDDDPITRETLRAYFEDEGFNVLQARNADELDVLLARHPVELILLDIRLPGRDGMAVTRELRANSDVGIILITGRSDQMDRIIGLELGADDYITKPFEPREILARSRSLLRRVNQRQAEGGKRDRHFGGWTLHPGKRRLTDPEGRDVRLTGAEFDLLAAFLDNPGRVLSRDTLLDLTPRRKGDPFDRSVDSLVGRLRRVLETDAKDPRIIVTVHGSGYIFTPEVT